MRPRNLLLAAALLLPPAAGLAGGFTIIEIGVRKTGMMAGIAKPDDLSAVYHNPAGIADMHGTRLHLSSGFSFVDASVRLKPWPSTEERPHGSDKYIDTPVGPDGYFEGTIKPTRYFGAMPMFVASSDFGWEEGPVWAFSVYVPDFIGAFLPEDAPSRYMVVEGYFAAGMASFTAAYRLPEPLEFLSVGGSIGLLYVRIAGKRWVNFPTLFDLNSDVVIDLVGEDYRPFWNLGVTADVLPGVTLGLALLGGTDVTLEGKLELSAPPGVEDPVLEALDEELGILGRYGMTQHMKIPYGINAGVNWAILPELELAVDFRWWFYRVFKEQVIEHNIDIEVMGEPLVENPMIQPKEYEDSWTLSAGVLGRPFPFPLELMAGWSYDHSPAPSHTKSVDSPTVNLTGFSLGARYTLFDTWRFSFTYYRYWYLKDVIEDSILDPPQNSEFHGTVDTFSVELEVIL